MRDNRACHAAEVRIDLLCVPCLSCSCRLRTHERTTIETRRQLGMAVLVILEWVILTLESTGTRPRPILHLLPRKIVTRPAIGVRDCRVTHKTGGRAGVT